MVKVFLFSLENATWRNIDKSFNSIRYITAFHIMRFLRVSPQREQLMALMVVCERGAGRERGAGGGCRIRSIPPRKYQPGAAALRSPLCHPFLSAFLPEPVANNIAIRHQHRGDVLPVTATFFSAGAPGLRAPSRPARQ